LGRNEREGASRRGEVRKKEGGEQKTKKGD